MVNMYVSNVFLILLAIAMLCVGGYVMLGFGASMMDKEKKQGMKPSDESTALVAVGAILGIPTSMYLSWLSRRGSWSY